MSVCITKCECVCMRHACDMHGMTTIGMCVCVCVWGGGGGGG